MQASFAGRMDSTSDLNREAQSVHRQQGQPNPQTSLCSQALLVRVQFELIELNWRSCDSGVFSS